jgi:TolB-like protein/class 3 adenylate cyclase
MPETRKIAAILAADIVGFSRLASIDEERTLARLRTLRSDLIDPTIAVHNGRVVKRTGDGILVEFRSVVDAVRCAIELQNGMVERNAGVSLERLIQFRVGVHLGDVVEESDGDLMGTGVNIAARLEGIATPGAICISEDAYRQVKGRLDLAVADLGEVQLKNIVEPVRAYALAAGNSHEAPGPPERPRLTLPERPSIAVLPFQNISGDPEQGYFADGVVEDIITALSCLKSLFVIARNSSFTYKGDAVDLKQVGRDLGVRYVLRGSVRKAGTRVRITGQLLEASSGLHIWADKFEGTLEDVFDLQDAVTERVVSAIEPSVRQAEINRAHAKPTNNLDAYDHYLRALPPYYQYTGEGSNAAVAHLRRAIQLDPGYTLAKSFSRVQLRHPLAAGLGRGVGPGERCCSRTGSNRRRSQRSLRLALGGAHPRLLGGPRPRPRHSREGGEPQRERIASVEQPRMGEVLCLHRTRSCNRALRTCHQAQSP